MYTCVPVWAFLSGKCLSLSSRLWTVPCLTLCSLMDCSSPGFPILHHHPMITQTHVHWVIDTIQPYRSLLASSLSAFNLARIQVFSNESALHIGCPKYWSFSFNISPSNTYSGMIPFRVDWFDSFAIQGTFKNLLQPHSSKASILWCSAFFIVQLPHPHLTTGKIIALTIWTFSKVMFWFLICCLGLFWIFFQGGSVF